MKIYSARAFFRQTFDLGGNSLTIQNAANQFQLETTSRRIVVTAGQFALIDLFDNNSYSHDPRTQFLNWSFLTHAASDYAADARGYTVGLVIEGYWDAWALRIGHVAQPKESNGLPLDYQLWKHFGLYLELEHDHEILGHPGKVRLLGFVNRANMAAFRDALTQQNTGVPDLSKVRHDQIKLGFGISLEQELTRDLGIFGRFSWNDGRTEIYAFTEVDLSLTAGMTLKGTSWFRSGDTLGFAVALNGLSSGHRQFLASGGIGPFLGDGRLNYSPEWILEGYYSFKAWDGLYFSYDFQAIWNPGYNADRGPVMIHSFRGHVEF